MKANYTNEHDTNTRMKANYTNNHSWHSRLFVNSCRGESTGFSVIELMVTTSIIAIVSSIVLFNFPSFSSKILLENLTHEIALVVRQAQVYGIGIKRTESGLFPSYGAHFDTTATPAENPPNKKVILFADLNGNKFYDGESEDIEIFEIQRGNFISGLCAVSNDSPCVPTNTIDITFKRPDPEAKICLNVDCVENISVAQITVSPPDGSDIGVRHISVWVSGQIAVTSAE